MREGGAIGCLSRGGMMFRRKGPQLTRQQSLNAIPVRNRIIEVRRESGGTAVLVLKRSKSRRVRLIAKLFYVPEERKIALDELGTYVWDLCDGRTPVKKIISLFASKHKLGRKEAEVSVVEYMKQLTKKGLLGLMVEKADDGVGKKRGGKGGRR